MDGVKVGGHNGDVDIAILAAGAGDMLCGSCLRDGAMAGAMRRLGHRVTLVPLYTPLRTDGDNVSIPDVFYGGVNVYLQHISALFRYTPRMLDWALDRPWLLRMAGNWGAQTSPDKVADLTASIVEGKDGPTRKELRRLIEFLKRDVQPQIVSLPNLMFIGAAGAIREALKVPVVCELTGEDIFLDAMSEPNRARLRDLIRRRTRDVRKFVAVSDYYASRMADYLDVERERIEVIPTGLSPHFFTPLAPRDPSPARAAKVGYLARICPEKGLDRLVDAMLLLRQKSGFEKAQLTAAGYLGTRDRAWFDALRNRIEQTSLRVDFTYLGEVDREAKIAMLDSLDVFSVPTAYPEAKGISVLEAMARGVPVAQPAHGAFPEMIAQTRGGVLATPNDPAALAEALAGLLADEPRRRQYAINARDALETHFTEERMALRTLHLYEALL